MGKHVYLKIAVILAGLLVGHPASANNLRISNVSLEDRNTTDGLVTVEFDVTWDNSWRDGINHDAVWLFIKFELGGIAPPTSELYHASLNNSGLNPPGFSPGKTSSLETSLELYVPVDFTAESPGAFLRRKSSGSGTVTAQDVRLVVDYGIGALNTQGVNKLTDLQARVYGIEMVYIPTGPFYAGHALYTPGAPFAEDHSSSGNVWYISSEGAIRTTQTSACCYHYHQGGGGGGLTDNRDFTIGPNFPKGYQAFYAMKYEVTEGQYVDFLQSLNSTQFIGRDITLSASAGKNSDSVLYRNTISGSTATNVNTHRPDRAMSYLSFLDLAGFLDWAALRPMTELEYEKMATGLDAPNRTTAFYSWGTSTYNRITQFTISPEDGTEQAFIATDNIANAQGTGAGTFYTQGDAFLGSRYLHGPVRVGIFADGAANSREQAGAGYFGVMELSGNVWEYALGVGNTSQNGASAFAFIGEHGDGVINIDGAADQTTWDDGSDVTQGLGYGRRGGSWESNSTTAFPYDREQATNDTATRGRARDRGGRGVRECRAACQTAINEDL